MRLKWRRALLLLAVASLCAALAVGMAGCNKGGDGGGTDDPAKVTAVTVTNGADVALELGKRHQIEYRVEPDTVVNKGVTFTSADPAIVKVNKNTGLVEAVKTGGPVAVTLASNEDKSVTAEVRVTVIDAVAREENKYTAELDPTVYTSGEVWADPDTAETGDSVVVYLVRGEHRYSFSGKLDIRKVFRFDMSKVEALTEPGAYGVETIFPTNEAAKLKKVAFNDVAVRNYVVDTENWMNGGDGKLAGPSTVGLVGTQDWGHVFKKYTVNRTSRRYITVTAKSVDSRWGLKIMADELGKEDRQIGEWDNAPANLVQTVDVASFSEFESKTGDFDIILKIFTIGPKADDPRVVIDDIAVHGGLKTEIAAVSKDAYKPITAIGEIAAQKLKLGEDTKITPVVTPADCSFSNLLWTSADTDIVTVSALGVLHPVAAGDTTITVSDMEQTVKKTFSVNVRQAVTGISLQKNSAVVGLNYRTFDLGALVTLSPANATVKDVTYEAVTGADAVSIDGSGVVTLVAVADEVKIAVTTTDGGYTAEFTLKIVENLVLPEGLAITAPESDEVLVGNDLQLAASFTNTPTDQVINWSSGDPSVATVSADGLVTAVGIGRVTITASANADDDVRDTLELIVTSKYLFAFDPAAYDWMKLDLAGLAAGDEVTVSATSSGNVSAGTPYAFTLGATPSLALIPMSSLRLSGSDVYAFTISATRNGAALAGYRLNGVSFLTEGTDILSLTNWEKQDAAFSIQDGVASLSRSGDPAWGHARTSVTFNLTKYPYLLFDVAELPEGLAYNVKLSSIGSFDDPALFGDVTADGYHLVDLKQSTNKLLAGTTGDTPLTFRLFFVGSPREPIKFAAIRFLSPAESAVSAASGIVAPTDFTLKQTAITLNLRDAEKKYGQAEVEAFTPENATFQGVRYSSSDDTVATVDAKGKITALKAGSATITVTSIANSALFKTIAVTVADEDVAYTVTADASVYGSLTAELEGASDGASVRLTEAGGKTFDATASAGKAVFDISSLGAEEKAYRFTLSGATVKRMFVTARLMQYDLSAGETAGDDSYAVTLVSDGNGTPKPVLTLQDGKYYNDGSDLGWGQVRLTLKGFDAQAYTYFELEVASIGSGAAYKVEAVAAAESAMLLVGENSDARTVRIDCSDAFKAYAAKGGGTLSFNHFVVGNGSAQYVQYGTFSAYHVIDAVKA